MKSLTFWGFLPKMSAKGFNTAEECSNTKLKGMICVGPKRSIEKYRSTMKNIDVSPEIKLQIIENCAKYATFKKIKSKKFTVTAVKKKDIKDGVV